MSASEASVNGNGKLFASKRHLYADKDIQPNSNKNCKAEKQQCASVPRHRISGKERMPPYVEAPVIKVPEARKSSQSRPRSNSKGRAINRSQAMCERGSFNPNKEESDSCLSKFNQMKINEQLLANEAVVMVVPKSYLSSVTSTASTSDKSMSSKGAKEESIRVPSQTDKNNGDVLGKKVPPLYIPRPCHKTATTEWDSSIENSESEEENETPWGKRLAGIKVTRVKRDFDEDTVSIEAPEGSLPVCARCGVVVYLAEEKRAAGRRFHMSCFKCFLCNCSLDSMNLYERNQEVYCKSCYIRQFGPKGYDYGTGEGALRME